MPAGILARIPTERMNHTYRWGLAEQRFCLYVASWSSRKARLPFLLRLDLHHSTLPFVTWTTSLLRTRVQPHRTSLGLLDGPVPESFPPRLHSHTLFLGRLHQRVFRRLVVPPGPLTHLLCNLHHLTVCLSQVCWTVLAAIDF
jgi:hypothetical protein